MVPYHAHNNEGITHKGSGKESSQLGFSLMKKKFLISYSNHSNLFFHNDNSGKYFRRRDTVSIPKLPEVCGDGQTRPTAAHQNNDELGFRPPSSFFVGRPPPCDCCSGCFVISCLYQTQKTSHCLQSEQARAVIYRRQQQL